MEALKAIAKVSEDGRLTLAVPDVFKGAMVDVVFSLSKRDTSPEVDKLGWPKGFREKFVGCIKDEKFERPPQGEADPLPSWE